MSKMTYQAYLTYIGQQTRMRGWGALLIYDRQKTNTLLAQEYIERFSSGSYFPPFTDMPPTDQNSWTSLANIVFDKPRLSFTNSNIASSRARLSMRVVSGEILSLNKGIGARNAAIVSVAKLDPLIAPYLYMNIRLEETNGGVVDGEGRVLLDLSKADSYTFKLTSSEEHNLKLGLAVAKEFKSWDADKQRFELNRFVAGEGLLKPSSFAVRTHSLARAGSPELAQDEDDEEGAVLVGVAFNGQSRGTFPPADADLPYLLPETASATDEPFSMNILLNNDLWVPELIGKMLAQIPEFLEMEPRYIKDARGFISKIVIGRGYTMIGATREYIKPPRRIVDPRGYIYYGYQIAHPDLRAEFDNDLLGNLEIVLSNGRLTVKWAGRGDWPMSVKLGDYLGAPWVDFRFNADWMYSTEYAYRIAQDGVYKGQVQLEATESIRNVTVTGGLFPSAFESELHESVKFRLGVKFNQILGIMINSGVSIDALRLNNLLFHSHQAAQPREVLAPGEFSLLGTLAPERTAFAIEPLEPVIGAGGTLQFSIRPQATGVHWTVENLPGETGAIGIISSAGLYRAPTADTFTREVSRRVLVIASQGSAVSRALVSITVSDISVYPWLQVAQYGRQRYVLVAGEGNGSGKLNWTLAPGSLGRVRDPGPQDADLDIPEGQSVKVYESPNYAPDPGGTYQKAVYFDQITVQGGSGNSQVIDVLVPWSTPSSWFTVEQVAQGVELTMWTQGLEAPVKIEPENAFWYLVTGAGELSGNLYIPEENGRGYAIIVAIENYHRLNYAYIVLPVPFVSTQHFNLLCEQTGAHNSGGHDHD